MFIESNGKTLYLLKKSSKKRQKPKPRQPVKLLGTFGEYKQALQAKASSLEESQSRQ